MAKEAAAKQFIAFLATWGLRFDEELNSWPASKIANLFDIWGIGAILTGAAREFCRTFPNQTEVTVRGSHFIQEDSPQDITDAVAAWIRSMDDA